MLRDTLARAAAVALTGVVLMACGTGSTDEPVALESARAPAQTASNAVDDTAALAALSVLGDVSPEPEMFPATVEIQRGARRTMEFHVVNHRATPIAIGRPTTSCGCVDVAGGETTIEPFGATRVKVEVEPRSQAELDYFQFEWTDEIAGDGGLVAAEIRIEG